MSYQITLVDETWGESVPKGESKTVADLPTAKHAIAKWVDLQVKHVRGLGHVPMVDSLPVMDCPAGAIISWSCEELIVTLVVTATEVKD